MILMVELGMIISLEMLMFQTQWNLWVCLTRQLTIFGWDWAKYRDLSVASRSIFCRSRRLRQIIDLWDTDKSRYFAITEFNNYFIIQSLSLFFLMNILGKRSDLPFSCKSDRKKEKGTVSFMHEKNIICSQTLLEALHMSRPLFVGSYLQVTWWALGQWKERKISFEW